MEKIYKKAGLIKIFKNKLFIFISIAALIVVSGSTAVFAIKQKKLAQVEPNPAPTDSPSADITTPTISKTAYGIVGNSNTIDPGEPINVNISFNGLSDGEGAVAGPADVMVVLDASYRMSQPLHGEDGRKTAFYYARKAVIKFLEMINDLSGSTDQIRVGLIVLPEVSNKYEPETKSGLTPMTPENLRSLIRMVNRIPEPGSHPNWKFAGWIGRGMKYANSELGANRRAGVPRYNFVLTNGEQISFNVGNWNIPATNADMLTGWSRSGGALCLNTYGEGVWEDFWPDNNAPHNSSVTSVAKRGGNKIVALGFGHYPPAYNWQTSPGRGTYCWCRGGLSEGNLNRMACVYTGEFNRMHNENNQPCVSPLLGTNYCPHDYYPWLLQRMACYTSDCTDLSLAPFLNNATTQAELEEGYPRLFNIFQGKGSGAPITLKETLPLGATVGAGDISVNRLGKGINPRIQIESDAQGRQVVTINIGSEHYTSVMPYENQRFNVRMRISSAGIVSRGCFDIDQNYNCNTGQKTGSVSTVTWSFPISGSNPIVVDTPKRCLCFVGAQYTGDVFGRAILDYIFPGIDVLVSAGVINRGAPSEAVWDLANYNFSGTSISNYNNFVGYMNSAIGDMIERAKFHSTATGIGAILLDPNPDYEVYPEGRIYHIRNPNNPQRLSGSYSIGSGQNQRRATIILEGDLIIGDAGPTNIVKSHLSNNVLIIVKGNVTITGNVERMDLGILAPFGNITVQNSTNRIEINGFLVGRTVNLRSTGSNQQFIRYDSQFALYPPPGPSMVNLPIVWEVAP